MNIIKLSPEMLKRREAELLAQRAHRARVIEETRARWAHEDRRNGYYYAGAMIVFGILIGLFITG